jgi:predicted Fe-Mo cluster-binding NifX family protein
MSLPGRVRILVPSSDGSGLESQVFGRLGDSPCFTVANLEEGEIVAVEIFDNPHRADHGPGLVPDFVRSLGVDVVVAGTMGAGARALFATMGIKVVSGAAGGVGAVLRSYLQGRLRDVAARASPAHNGARPHVDGRRGGRPPGTGRN